jgi:hypothetical protein
MQAQRAGQELTKRIAQIIDAGIVRHSRMSAAKMVNMISYTKHIDFQVTKRGPSEKKVSEAKEYLDNLLEPPLEKEFNSDLEDRVLPLACWRKRR